jgi:hypothetical protein
MTGPQSSAVASGVRCKAATVEKHQFSARGGDKIPGDFYGLRPEEIVRQRPVAPLGVTPRADYGLMTLRGLAGLPIYTGPIIGARLPRSGDL